MFSFIIAAVLFSYGSCERLHNQIYSSIEGGAACFRRLNGTHQAGCTSSSENGAVGTVHWVWGSEDARWVAGGGGGAAPYVVLVNTVFFNQIADALIASPSNVAGVVVYENTTQVAQHFSSESHCPNEYSSGPGSHCDSSSAWNPQGSGLLRRDIPFPIFYLPAARFEEVDKILDCYTRFNVRDQDQQSDRPLCALQLSSFMFAAVNTEVCMRRSASQFSGTKQCDPLGDRNIHSSLFRRSADVKEANRSVVLVTARMDSASLFDGISPGAASSAVGVVTLLTAASTLSAMLPPEQASAYNANVVWALLSGETFDYIGSQRVAYDMRSGAWPPEAPLSPAGVRLHLELGQLGGALGGGEAGAWRLTAFATQYDAPEDEQIRQFVSLIPQTNKLTVGLKVTSNLPPSSLHSFRRILGETPAKGGLPELLLVDHGDTFTNNFYQSVLDDKKNVNFTYANVTVDNGNFLDTDTMISRGYLHENSSQVKISHLADAVALALYHTVTGDAYTGGHKASAHLVDELLHCYLDTANCSLFLASEQGPADGRASAPVELQREPYPLYTGVRVWYSLAPYATGLLLAFLTGERNGTSAEDCLNNKDKEYTYTWMNGWNHTGVCIKSTLNFTEAVSPAFTIEGYDWRSGEFSTWSESVWRSLWARVFVAPSGRGARLAAGLGAAATLLITLLTYWLQRHSGVVFAKRAGDVVSVDVDPSAAGILRTVNC